MESKPRTIRGIRKAKKALKVVEGPKLTIFCRANKASQPVLSLLKDLVNTI